MSFALAFHLDKWLWQRGLGHPVLMPILRNEILLAVLPMAIGLPLFVFTPWLFWFGFGAGILAYTFFGLTHFFLHRKIDTYTAALFLSVLLRWSLRFGLTVLLLYGALVLCGAPVTAILAGLVCASIVALLTYAITQRNT